MRIARFYYNLPPVKGGMESHIFSLSLEQIKMGHDVVVFYAQGGEYEFGHKIVPRFSGLSRKMPQALRFLFFYLEIFNQIRLNNYLFDVIHIHGDWSSFLFGQKLKNKTKSKFLLGSLHGSIAGYSWFKRDILIRFLRCFDGVYATGFETASILSDQNIHVKTIPSGVSEAFYKISSKTFRAEIKRIAIVSNLVPVKNLDLVLDVAKEFPELEFTIFGEGELRDYLENRILKENIHSVQIYGHVSKQELSVLLEEYDILMHTSKAEGTATSILEAMVKGLPIITSNAGGIAQLIKNGKNGYVHKDLAVENYVDSIKRLKQDKDLVIQMSKNNFNTSRNWSWRHRAAEITAIMENLE